MLSARIAPTMHGEGPNWAAIIRRVAESDQCALGDLYDATSPLVLGLIRRIVEDFPTAEEITLDVYTQVWRLASTYSQEKGTPMTWLLMLARSRAIDRARRAKDLERPIEAALDYSHAGPSPETAAVSESRRRIIQRCWRTWCRSNSKSCRWLFSTGSAIWKLRKEQEFLWAPSRAEYGQA